VSTTVVHSIGIDGGSYDYASAAAWWSAQGGDLVAANEIRIGEYRGDWSSTADVLAGSYGSITDSARYAVLRTNLANRHLLVPDTSKARMSGFTQINSPYMRIEGIQILGTGGIGLFFTQPGNIANSVLSFGCNYGIMVLGPESTVINCASSGASAGILFGSSATGGYIAFCSAVGDYDPFVIEGEVEACLLYTSPSPRD
jgi:hypothetical protein